jgi:hypothetical protein
MKRQGDKKKKGKSDAGKKKKGLRKGKDVKEGGNNQRNKKWKLEKKIKSVKVMKGKVEEL